MLAYCSAAVRVCGLSVTWMTLPPTRAVGKVIVVLSIRFLSFAAGSWIAPDTEPITAEVTVKSRNVGTLMVSVAVIRSVGSPFFRQVAVTLRDVVVSIQ